jgi:hypothetical protein
MAQAQLAQEGAGSVGSAADAGGVAGAGAANADGAGSARCRGRRRCRRRRRAQRHRGGGKIRPRGTEALRKKKIIIWFMFALRVLCRWWIDAAACPAAGVTCSSGAGNSASSRQCHLRVASS